MSNSPQSHSIVVFDEAFAKGVHNYGIILFILPILIASLVITSSFGIAEATMQRDVIIKPIFTMKDGDRFNHAFAVCSSQLMKDDIIIVSSDSAVSPINIDNDKKIITCTTFDAKILAIDPITIKAEIIKTENKNKTIQKLENKIDSLNNIIERKLIERDELLTNLNLKDNKKASDILSRIFELMEYNTKTEKKLAIILST